MVKVADIPYRASFSSVFDKTPEVGHSGQRITCLLSSWGVVCGCLFLVFLAGLRLWLIFSERLFCKG